VSGCHHGGEESKRGGRGGESGGPGMERQEEHGLGGWIQAAEPKSGMHSGVTGVAVGRKQGTVQHHKLSKKDRQEHGADGKENGGWKTTSY